MSGIRLDLLAVRRGLAPTRSGAARLIERGALRFRRGDGWNVARKAGELIAADCTLEVTDDAELRFVSRGGLKLDAALERSGIDVAGRQALDLGQSTGGFTDVLLRRGAARVVGLDVGHGQLHPTLAADARVVAYEGVNARDPAASPAGAAFFATEPAQAFGIVVADLSFISLTLALPTVVRSLEAGGDALLLVKPQFELQPADVGRGGIVRDPAAWQRVERRLRDACAASRLAVVDWFESAIEGGDGNREFFLRARPAVLDTAP